MGLKWASEYGRIDFIEYLIKKRNIITGFKEALDWAEHSRKMTENARDKIVKYLKDKIKEYGN
jgi:hypothetical protein